MEINSNTHIKVINNFFIFLLTILAIYYGRERCLFFDGADRLYEAIVYKKIFFGHSRFPTMLNGIIPWIISYISNSPIYILWGYIINYAFTPLIFFFIFRFFFKDEYLVTFFIVGLILFYTILIFHPNHDVLFSYYYTILLYSFLKKVHYSTKYYSYWVFFLSLLFSFSHQSQVPTTIILLLYLKYYQKSEYPLVKVFSIFFATIAIKIFLFSNSYEIGIYSRITDATHQIKMLIYSPLIKTYFQSFYTVNLVVTLVLLVTSYILIKSKKIELIIFIVLNFIFTLLFITFFFNEYPYNFCTEGYLKGSTLLLSIVFLDYFIFNSMITPLIRNTVMMICYILTIIIILLNGINYKIYHNNIEKMSENIKNNTIYVSQPAKDIEQYFILHRQSALINLIENRNCDYFQYCKDSNDIHNNHVYTLDVENGKLCFGEKAKIESPDYNLKRILDTQGSLIFELTNIHTRLNYKKYIYNN